MDFFKRLLVKVANFASYLISCLLHCAGRVGRRGRGDGGVKMWRVKLGGFA